MEDRRDLITLEGMRFAGRHGVLDDERAEPQPFVVSVAFPVDARRAAAADDLRSTIDYAAVFECVRSVVETESHRLIETLAEAIAGAVLERVAATAVDVRVRKPNAPLPGSFDHVEISIHRGRGEHHG